MPFQVSHDAADKKFRFWSNSFCKRMALPLDDKDVGYGYMTIPDVCREILIGAGYDREKTRFMQASDAVMECLHPRFAARAANTSGDLPNLLSNVTQKALIKSYGAAKPTWKLWCKVGDLSDFKVAKRIQLTDAAALRETGENGEILDSKIGDRGENIQLGAYARRLSFSMQAMINDDLGALKAIGERFGRAGAALPSRLAYTHLLANPTMSDGNALFHSSHGNLLTGAGSNLDASNKVAALTAAMKAFRNMKAPQAPNDTEFPEEPVDIQPEVLLVPPDHEYHAETLANPNAFVFEGAGFFKNKLTVGVESRLANAGFSGYSATAWYLAAGPDTAAMEVAFLNGKEEVQVNSWNDPDRLGVSFRGVLCCGVRAVDWRCIVKNAGA